MNKRGGDVVGWLQDKVNPPEMHIPGYQYCGPFTKLHKRLERGDPGINRVDKVCKKHDVAYSKSKNTADRHIADQEMLNELDLINNPSSAFYPLGEKQARAVIKPIISAKKRFGLGISPNINSIYCLKSKGTCAVYGTKKAVFL
ncbi:uncharacterized protein LOC111616212 [Centruroides sculpturatus]|uniref:uncharacterized protein LOC111616212 n=1 Tax=Centruroides sculpturatus TaxID=218467 RepID=UPI000C6E660E|nr:uncharacterized protein LOC111616212 [Centruroides sculpturatus]